MNTHWYRVDDSSFIVMVGYDISTKILHVIIDTSDGLVGYSYYNFPVSMFDNFMNSTSKGLYLNTHIKGFYDFSS